MYKKVLGMFLMGTLFFFCSCVDDTYDLANKEISTDVEIKGNRLALPLGSLRAIMLDSIISVEDIDLLDKMDGVYSISMADTIAPYEYEMPEIKFSIPTQRSNVSVDDFAKAEITEVHIEGQSPQETKFTVPEISLDDLKIPSLNTDRSASAANDQVKDILEQHEGSNGEIDDNLPPILFDQTFTLEDGEVEFELDYELPEEIETLYTIFLKKGSDDSNSQDGALIGFEIIHPDALKDLDKTVDFTITFPEGFVVSLDDTAEGNYSQNGNTISVKGLSVEAGETKNSVISFYINKLKDLDEKIENGLLSLDEIINYTVDYQVNGELKLKSGTKLEDFDFKVVTDLALGFRDVEGRTKDLDIDFDPITMDFDIDFDNLKYIDKIEYIEFDASESKLHFHTEMEGGFEPFALKEGYALKLEFPSELIINEEKSQYPRTTLDGKKAVEYNKEEHAFYIYDLEVFNSLITDEDSEGNPIYYHWALALDRFDLHEPVVDGKFHHHVEALVTVAHNGTTVDNLVLASTHLESLNSTLETLKDKKVNFKIWNSDFKIDDAVVHTEKIVSELKETVPFEFSNNDLPKEIRRVEAIGFNKETPIHFNIKVNGLEDLDTHITLDLHVKLPSALEVSANDKNNDIEISGDTLLMKVDIDPKSQDPTVIELLCSGLDFTKGLEGKEGGIHPTIINDKGYIEYNSDIDIVGNVIVDGSDFHSYVLDKQINVDVDFEIDDILVKDFHGIFYIDNLGGIEQSFDLNLGDNLEFLKNEENTIVLSDPQITITVNNSISIPISANLSLVGKDANGDVIESSIVEDVIKIDAADYDQETGQVTSRATNLLISAHPVEKEGYKNMPIESLANLLKQIPNSLDIVLTPIIDTIQTQHINLVQPLSFSGNYAVAIPLQFDEFKFVYSDTISDLKVGLGETLEMFSNVELGLNMNIKNSLPLELKLNAIPLSEDGDTIHGIEISELTIPAGSGVAYSDTISGKTMNFNIKSNDPKDISTLDKLKFDVKASTTSTVGGAALRGDQGIQLSDIVIEIAGDISTDLSK